MRKIVVFGNGDTTHVVAWHIERWNLYEIVAFVEVSEKIKSDTYLGRPLVDIENATEQYPPDEYDAFVAVGYHELNELRLERSAEMKRLGYKLVSAIAPSVTKDIKYGENCLVADGSHIHPCVTLQDNVFIWEGTVVGHHALIDEGCWFGAGCSIGGRCEIGARTFLGVGVNIAHKVVVGAESILGAGALVTKSLPDASVVIAEPTPVYRLNSRKFLGLAKRFGSLFG